MSLDNLLRSIMDRFSSRLGSVADQIEPAPVSAGNQHMAGNDFLLDLWRRSGFTKETYRERKARQQRTLGPDPNRRRKVIGITHGLAYSTRRTVVSDDPYSGEFIRYRRDNQQTWSRRNGVDLDSGVGVNVGVLDDALANRAVLKEKLIIRGLWDTL